MDYPSLLANTSFFSETSEKNQKNVRRLELRMTASRRNATATEFSVTRSICLRAVMLKQGQADKMSDY